MELFAALLVTLAPFATVVLLLLAARALERRRAERTARQVAVTEAIHRELGAVVAPVVEKRVFGPWRLYLRVPLERPGLVARIVAAASAALPHGALVVLIPRSPATAGR
jgi:hypothetical protein